MKHLLKMITVLAIILSSSAYADEAVKNKSEELKTEKTEAANPEADALNQKNSISYCIGLDMGSEFKEMGIEISPEMLLKGFKDGISGSKPALSEEEMLKAEKVYQQVVMEKKKVMMAEQQKKAAELSVKNKEEGEKFLTENKKKKGVVTTDSGLQYIVLKKGNGDKPKATDTVTVHYKGTFLDGTEFDSSYKRNKPDSFPLNGVIKGMTEGLQLMAPGAKYKFFVPSELAYGKKGAGRDIGPDVTLIFEVELLGIEPPEAKTEDKNPGAQ
jgi:FKBP-type peptidyl-prolyl cis-trans isomerase